MLCKLNILILNKKQEVENMFNTECNPMLAHAYIPMQQWPDETYDLERSLTVGTIFPCLNQPMCEYEWGETK